MAAGGCARSHPRRCNPGVRRAAGRATGRAARSSCAAGRWDACGKPREPARQPATLQKVPKLLLDEAGQPFPIAETRGPHTEGLEVILHDLVEHTPGGRPRFVASGRQGHTPRRGGSRARGRMSGNGGDRKTTSAEVAGSACADAASSAICARARGAPAPVGDEAVQAAIKEREVAPDPELTLSPLRGIVVLDESQRRPDLFSALRVLVDRLPAPARFLVLGSAAPELLRQSTESLAGRIAFHELSAADHAGARVA